MSKNSKQNIRIPSNVDPIYAKPQSDEKEFEQVTTIPCGICGRSFNQESLRRHMKICEKIFVQKREKYDMKEKRLEDLQNEPNL